MSHDLFDDLERLSIYQRAIELQNVLIAACEGKRDGVSNQKYLHLRRWAREIPLLQQTTPPMVVANHDLDAFWSYIKSVSEQWEPRRQHVRNEFQNFISAAEALPETWPEIASSAWTGIQSPREQAIAAKALIPVAQASIEALIDHFERGRGNGGPPLEEHEKAIESLRALHAALGKILDTIDREASSSLQARKEAVEFLGRAARELRDDPLPFAISALVMSVLTVVGLPSVGGWLSAAVIGIRKRPSDRKQ